MRVVAVIPTWRGHQRLPEVVAALAGDVSAIVIVHNGPREPSAASECGATDGAAGTPGVAATAQLAQLRPQAAAAAAHGGPEPTTDVVHLTLEGNVGFAAAANRGIAQALALDAEGILLVNDDAFFQAGAVAALRQELASHPKAAAVSAHTCYEDRPGVLNGAGGRIIRWRGLARLRGDGETDCGQYAKSPEVDYPSGAACLIRRSAWQQIGQFDEAYYLYYEDADWGRRAQLAGYSIRYVPAARVLHVGCASTADDPARRRYYNVRNRLRFAARHARPVGLAWAWLATWLLVLKQPVRWLTPHRRRDAAAVVFGVLDHLAGRYGQSAQFG